MTLQTANVTDFYGKEEAEQLKDYIDTYYAVKVPPPAKPKPEELSFWKLAGFETLSFFIPSISFAIFSAIRTSGFFFVQEKTHLERFGIPVILVWLLSFVVMLSSILGFEGILLARGIKRGRQQDENKEENWATILSVSVIISVAIYTGVSMIQGIPDNVMLYIDVFMILLTGIAGGIITFFGGNDIGFAWKTYETKKETMLTEHQTKYDEWYEKAVQSYISTKKQVSKVTAIPNSSRQPNQTETEQGNSKNQSKAQRAYDFVKQYYLKNGDLPTNKIVSDGTGLAVGTAFSAIESFVFDNAEELVSKGLVSQEKVDKIRKSKGISNRISSVSEWIETWIVQNNKFPEKEDIDSAGIPLVEVAKWVVEHQDKLRGSGLVDEQTIQGAINVVQG